jgi:sulfur carrier protein
MTVVVNGTSAQLADGATVADVVRSLGRDPQRPGTAAACNGEVVPRRVWEATPLTEGDRIELLDAVGGG